jgi:hypothetical protein
LFWGAPFGRAWKTKYFPSGAAQPETEPAKPKAGKKAKGRAQSAKNAPVKGKASKKATAAKNAPKAKTARPAPKIQS